MLCRGCNSDSHLIRHCPTLRKADLVNYTLQTGEVATTLTVNQLLDTAQDLPDEVWQSISEQISEPHMQNSPFDDLEPPESPKDAISHAMFTRLASWADQHDILREIQCTDAMTLAYDQHQSEQNPPARQS